MMKNTNTVAIIARMPPLSMPCIGSSALRLRA